MLKIRSLSYNMKKPRKTSHKECVSRSLALICCLLFLLTSMDIQESNKTDSEIRFSYINGQ